MYVFESVCVCFRAVTCRVCGCGRWMEVRWPRFSLINTEFLVWRSPPTAATSSLWDTNTTWLLVCGTGGWAHTHAHTHTFHSSHYTLHSPPLSSPSAAAEHGQNSTASRRWSLLTMHSRVSSLAPPTTDLCIVMTSQILKSLFEI